MYSNHAIVFVKPVRFYFFHKQKLYFTKVQENVFEIVKVKIKLPYQAQDISWFDFGF